MLWQHVLKNFDVDHLAYAWYLIHFELMRCYFDGETYLQFLRPKLGQQIQLQETKAIGSESTTNLIAEQTDILHNAIENFITDIFDHTKKNKSSDHSQINASDEASETERNEKYEKWKSRYIAQVSSLIMAKNVFAISTVHWQLSQATQLLATKAILPHLPAKHTLPVRNVRYRECMRVYVTGHECV